MAPEIERSKSEVILIGAGCALNYWTFWVNSHSYASGSLGSLLNPNVFACLCLAALAFMGGRVIQSRWAPGIDVSLGTLGSMSAVCVVFGGELPDWAWLLVYCLSGISLAWLQLRLIMMLMSYGLPSVLSLSLLASIAFVGLLLLSTVMTRVVGELLGALAPLACGLSLGCNRAMDKPHEGLPYYDGSFLELICGPCACMFGLYFVYAAANILLKVDFGGTSGTSLSWISYGCTALLLVIAFKAFVRDKRSVNFYALAKIPVALLALALVAAGLTQSSPFLQVLTFTSVWVINITFQILVVDMLQHCGDRRLRWAGLSLALSPLSYYLGRILFYSVASETSGVFALNQTLCFILLGVIVLIVVAFFRPESHVAHLLLHDLNNAGDPVSLSGSQDYEQRCLAFARSRGLSERETEIMLYIAKGYSKPFIAEKLFITDNTVRTHVKRIYEKVGVHSKRELQELIEDAE